MPWFRRIAPFIYYMVYKKPQEKSGAQMIKRLLILSLAGLLLASFYITCSTSDNDKKEGPFRLEERLKIIRAEKDPKFVKRLNIVNETLDKIDKGEYISYRVVISSYSDEANKSIAEQKAFSYLIENSDIALPLMMERLNTGKFFDRDEILNIYFMVFGKTKSAESIPYIADYIASCPESYKEFLDSRSGPFTYALMVAKTITSLKELENAGQTKTIFDRCSDIANRLRQWYAEYKKNQNK